MPRRGRDLRSVAFFTLVVLLLILFLSNVPTASEGMRQGLSLCADTLLPTLFPFLVLSELMISCHVGEVAGKLLQRPMKLLFGISGAGTAALLAGMLCGFPVGTAAAVSLYDRGEITQEELKRLFLFVNNPSPGFLIGAVGGGLFGSIRAGVALWLIVWGVSLAIGILLRVLGGVIGDHHTPLINGVQAPPSVSDLTAAVTKGLSTLLQVFAFVLFFSCITACIAPVLHTLPLPAAARALLLGLPEMTAGVAYAVKTLPTSAAYPLAAFLAGFGGLSVCLQLFSVGEGRGLHPLIYLTVKTVQGCLSMLLSFFCMRYVSLTSEAEKSVPTFAQNTVQQCSLGVVVGIALLCSALWAYQSKNVKREKP